MPALHFHPVYAWNLIADLKLSGVIPEERLVGYAEHRLHKLVQRKLLTAGHRAAARQMFVFADSVVLPGEADVAIGGLDLYEKGHLGWGESILSSEERSLITGRANEHIDTGWAPQLAQLLQHPDIDQETVLNVIDWWRQLQAFEKKARKHVGSEEQWKIFNDTGLRASIADGMPEEAFIWPILNAQQRKSVLALAAADPLRERRKFEAVEEAVNEVCGFYQIADRLAQHGCPTLAQPVQREAVTIPKEPDGFEALVRFYFEADLPSPENAKEALAYRQNDRVIEWRKKISLWQKNLADGTIDHRDIKLELEDASSYIGGSRSINTITGRISPWVPFGLATVLMMFPHFPAKEVIEIGLYSIEAIKQAGSLIESSVTGKRPLKYGWVLIEPPKPKKE